MISLPYIGGAPNFVAKKDSVSKNSVIAAFDIKILEMHSDLYIKNLLEGCNDAESQPGDSYSLNCHS